MLRAFTRNTRIMSESIENSLAEKVGEITLQGQDKTQINDGEVLVKKGSGKTKIRKGQSAEEFQIQKEEFMSTGPKINTLTWLEELDLTKIDPKIKSDRAQLENLTERLYFKRDYTKCLEVTNFALDLFKDLSRTKIKNEFEDLEYIQKQCLKRIPQE